MIVEKGTDGTLELASVARAKQANFKIIDLPARRVMAPGSKVKITGIFASHC